MKQWSLKGLLDRWTVVCHVFPFWILCWEASTLKSFCPKSPFRALLSFCLRKYSAAKNSKMHGLNSSFHTIFNNSPFTSFCTYFHIASGPLLCPLFNSLTIGNCIISYALTFFSQIDDMLWDPESLKAYSSTCRKVTQSPK